MSHVLIKAGQISSEARLLSVLALVFLCTSFGTFGANDLVGKVVSVTDGDTLTVLVDNQQYKIRLAEIDAPERRQPWGNRAKQALANKVFGEAVRVEVVTADRYGRTVGHVNLGNRDINRELLAFEQKAGKRPKWEASRGHDDLVVAAASAVFGRSAISQQPNESLRHSSRDSVVPRTDTGPAFECS